MQEGVPPVAIALAADFFPDGVRRRPVVVVHDIRTRDGRFLLGHDLREAPHEFPDIAFIIPGNRNHGVGPAVVGGETGDAGIPGIVDDHQDGNVVQGEGAVGDLGALRGHEFIDNVVVGLHVAEGPFAPAGVEEGLLAVGHRAVAVRDGSAGFLGRNRQEVHGEVILVGLERLGVEQEVDAALGLADELVHLIPLVTFRDDGEHVRLAALGLLHVLDHFPVCRLFELVADVDGAEIIGVGTFHVHGHVGMLDERPAFLVLEGQVKAVYLRRRQGDEIVLVLLEGAVQGDRRGPLRHDRIPAPVETGHRLAVPPADGHIAGDGLARIEGDGGERVHRVARHAEPDIGQYVHEIDVVQPIVGIGRGNVDTLFDTAGDRLLLRIDRRAQHDFAATVHVPNLRFRI